MKNGIFASQACLIELLTPKQDAPDFEGGLAAFRERFFKIRAHNSVVSIPDNPMGNLHFTAMEVLEHLQLELEPESLLIHLNTFHRKADLDSFLSEADTRGIRYLLCVSGDGSPRLPKLAPEDFNFPVTTITSVELLKYIHGKYPGRFSCGVAFNQYEPEEHETAKLRRKLEAGANFIITQPVMDLSRKILDLGGHDVPVFVGAWLSKRLDLLYPCVGVEPPNPLPEFLPDAHFRQLAEWYPDFKRYCTMLGFKRDWAGLFPQIKSGANAVA